MRMGSGANGKARGRHVELCKLPSKEHPTRLEAACGAALLLLITTNSALPIQFNTSATFGKAFYSRTRPKISGGKLIHSLFLLFLPQTVKIHATEKRCNHARLQTAAEPSETQYTELLKQEGVIVPGSLKIPAAVASRILKLSGVSIIGTCKKFNNSGAIVEGSHPGLDLMKFITFL